VEAKIRNIIWVSEKKIEKVRGTDLVYIKLSIPPVLFNRLRRIFAILFFRTATQHPYVTPTRQSVLLSRQL
jgi:hypothetical protein